MTKKRGHGEASYRERIINGSQYFEGRIMIDGKRYSRYAKTITECRKKIDKLKFFGVKKKAEDYTVKEWIKKWLEEEVKLQRREKTYMDYKGIANKHLIPAFEDTFLSDLSRKDIQAFVDRQKKRGLNPSTIEVHMRILSLCLKLAVKDEILEKNPCQYLSLPKKEKASRTWLSADDLKKFLTIDTTNDTKGNALKFSTLTGLRRGELLALKWSDIDYDQHTVKVSKSLTKVAKGWTISKTKTNESIRTIPLNDIALEILNDQKKLTGSNALIFSKAKGTHFNPSSLYDDLKCILKQAGLQNIRIHDLRHSFASILHEANIDHKTIQSLLGHANIQTTLNIYVHSDDKNKKKATQTMGDLLK